MLEMFTEVFESCTLYLGTLFTIGERDEKV